MDHFPQLLHAQLLSQVQLLTPEQGQLFAPQAQAIMCKRWVPIEEEMELWFYNA